MFPVRYIHAADLHLDAAFKGISREASNADLGPRLRAATFTALERLIALCEKEKPDFLVIAGDIYNEEDRSLKAQLALRDGCERLKAQGIQVFLVHGNHDPLPSRLQTLRWPDNTIIFSDTVQSHVVHRQGQPVAVVHGISHATAKEARNLASAFSRLSTEEAAPCFQLGLLHCTLDALSHSDRYAPCTVQDLKDTGLDAWALGHVHERKIVCEAPFVAYSGNAQGLHIHEAGVRGCWLVTAQPGRQGAGDEGTGGEDTSFSCAATFHALSPVIWENLEVNVEGVQSLDLVEQRIQEALEQAASHSHPACEILLLRARLTGRTELDAALRSPETGAELCERLRQQATGRPLAWLKDVVVDTGQWLRMEELLLREDLLGETLRLARDSRLDDAALQNLTETALSPLFRHTRARKTLEAPETEELQSLLDDAQRLCIDLMESR